MLWHTVWLGIKWHFSFLTYLKRTKVHPTERAFDDVLTSWTLVFSPNLHTFYVDTVTTSVPKESNLFSIWTKADIILIDPKSSMEKPGGRATWPKFGIIGPCLGQQYHQILYLACVGQCCLLDVHVQCRSESHKISHYLAVNWFQIAKYSTKPGQGPD